MPKGAAMTDIRTLERNLYRSLWQDGLLDLFVGVGLILIGITWLADLVPLGAIAPVILLPFWPLARRAVVAPRTGSFTVGPERRVWERRGLLTMALLGVGTLGLGVALYLYLATRGGAGDALATVVPGLPNTLVALGLIGVGVTLGALRFVGYGAALIAIGALAALGLFGPGWAFVIGGAALLLGGGLVLARFVHENPIPPDETPGA
jgi:hypothetical protein